MDQNHPPLVGLDSNEVEELLANDEMFERLSHLVDSYELGDELLNAFGMQVRCEQPGVSGDTEQTAEDQQRYSDSEQLSSPFYKDQRSGVFKYDAPPCLKVEVKAEPITPPAGHQSHSQLTIPGFHESTTYLYPEVKEELKAESICGRGSWGSRELRESVELGDVSESDELLPTYDCKYGSSLSPASVMSGRTSSCQSVDKRERRREQNRRAAKKCRNRKKTVQDKLIETNTMLAAENEMLKQSNAQKDQELERAKFLIHQLQMQSGDIRGQCDVKRPRLS